MDLATWSRRRRTRRGGSRNLLDSCSAHAPFRKVLLVASGWGKVHDLAGFTSYLVSWGYFASCIQRGTVGLH
jgi:hypothetical protein